MRNQAAVPAGEQEAFGEACGIAAEEPCRAVWDGQGAEPVLSLWHILDFRGIAIEYEGFRDGHGSLPLPEMEVEHRQRQGFPTPQPAGVYEIDKCPLPIREVRLPYGIPLRARKRPLLPLRQLREAYILAYHVVHPGAYVIVRHGHPDDLPEGEVDLLARPWPVQGIIDGKLEMAVADVRKPYAIQEGKVVLNDVPVHGLGVLFPDALLGGQPSPGVVQEEDVRLLHILAVLHAVLKLAYLPLQVRAGLFRYQPLPVFAPIRVVCPVPDFRLKFPTGVFLVFCLCHNGILLKSGYKK